MKIEVTCMTCGASFMVLAAYVARGRGKYCSMPCRSRMTPQVKDQVLDLYRQGVLTREIARLVERNHFTVRGFIRACIVGGQIVGRRGRAA